MRFKYPLLLIFIFSVIFFIPRINKKLIGHHDWNSVVYSASARSLLGKAETGEVFYQQDYPALLPLSLSLSFLIFGIKEWSVRLVPIIFTFSSSVIIYFLVKKIWGRERGLIAAILYLNTPLIRYFGKIAVHETIVPFFVLLTFFTYWLWLEKQTIKRYLFLLISIFLAEQSGWPGFYPIPLITLHYWLFSKNKKIMIMLNWWLLSFFSFGLFLLSDYLITGKIPFQSLLQIFITRTAFNKNDFYQFSWIQFLSKELLWIRVYLTRILTLFIFVWFINLVFFYKKILISKTIFLLLLAIFGLIHLLLFRQLCWLHDYMIIYLFPFLVIAASGGFELVIKKFKINYFIGLSILLFLMFWESRTFLNALERNQDFYPAYEIGNYVKQKTKPGEKVIFFSREASKFYGVFFYFYADRNYGTEEPSFEQFLKRIDFYKKNYRYLIVDEQHNRLTPELVNYLDNNYESQKVGIFRVFKPNNL